MTGFDTRHRRVTIRGQQVTEQDWRGILAVLTTLGYFSTALMAIFRFGFAEVIAIVGFSLTPEMLVLNWYFKAKEERR